jgi:hypothetical protein
MELAVVILPILAAVIWYSLFAQIKFSGLGNELVIMGILRTIDETTAQTILSRGTMSRLEYWSIKRAHDEEVKRQLGISSFEQARGIDAVSIDEDLYGPAQKLNIRPKA